MNYIKQLLLAFFIVMFQVLALSSCLMDQGVAYRAIAGVRHGEAP